MTEIEFLEQSVNRAKAVQRLLENPDFKDVFVKAQEDKLLEIGYNFHHLEGDRAVKANDEQKAIGYFFNRVYTILNDGEQAKEALEQAMEELDNV